MRPKNITLDLDTPDGDGLADGASSAGASVVPNGVLCACAFSDGGAYQVYIKDAGNDDQSTATYTITGTDALDMALVEAITGPTALATVITAGYFKTITSIAIANGVGGSTADIGNATDPDGLADGNDSSGTSIVLDGALTSWSFTAADGIAKRIEITDAGGDDQQAATYTITGTDEQGTALVEAIGGPDASSTVTTTGYFKTVISIAIADPVADSTVDIGTADEAVSGWVLTDRYADKINYGLTVTGTINYKSQVAFDHLNAEPAQTAGWQDQATNKSADFHESIAPPEAMRIVVNSYSAGAALVWNVLTQGYR